VGCLPLRDVEIVRVAGRCCHNLIGFAALNDLDDLQQEFLTNAHRCRDICMEERRGTTFTEGQRVLEELIKDALDLPYLPQSRAKNAYKGVP
jgi:hypothetical protein